MATLSFSTHAGKTFTLDFQKTSDGWNVHLDQVGGECSPTADPFLYYCFHEGHVTYPSSLHHALNDLWHRWEELSESDRDSAFAELGAWISATDATVPSGGVLHVPR